MLEDLSENYENLSEIFDKELTNLDTKKVMRDLLERAAGHKKIGETTERCIERAAHRLGLGFVRARSFWRGEARRVDAHEFLNALHRLKKLERQYEKVRLERLQAMAKAGLDKNQNWVCEG